MTQLPGGGSQPWLAPETYAAPAADIESADPAVHRAAAAAKRAGGDELGALAHLVAAETLEARAAEAPGYSVTGLCDVATGYFMKGEYETAARWYRLALTLDPKLAVAYQNLAAIYTSAGRIAEAESCRVRAYQIQRVFVEQAGNPVRRVLILCAGHASGNVPFETLLPTSRCCRIKYVIDYAEDAEDAGLPAYDLVFNVVGEPDVAAAIAGRVERFAAQCGRPVLNPPAAIARTQRHHLPALLDGIEDVAAASCIRCDTPPASRAALAALLVDAGIAFPVLARPAATHGGEGMVRCKSLEELEIWLCTCQGSCYLAAFHDCRSPDVQYRKYRMIFVDREPYPYHLAISPHWMVHYFSAGMEKTPWKIEEERGFLQNPATALGSRAMAAIAAIGSRLDLDFGGIDFALLPDGRVFVFEANATMLVHRERNDGVLAHKNLHVQNIVDAFERMQARRTAG
jgi:tetratricopeptide (TPR) repeat protein